MLEVTGWRPWRAFIGDVRFNARLHASGRSPREMLLDALSETHDVTDDGIGEIIARNDYFRLGTNWDPYIYACTVRIDGDLDRLHDYAELVVSLQFRWVAAVLALVAVFIAVVATIPNVWFAPTAVTIYLCLLLMQGSMIAFFPDRLRSALIDNCGAPQAGAR